MNEETIVSIVNSAHLSGLRSEILLWYIYTSLNGETARKELYDFFKNSGLLHTTYSVDAKQEEEFNENYEKICR